jgi:proteasome lid subunit RPN8/RPN11
MNYYDLAIKDLETAHLLKGKNLRIKPYILPYNERRRLHGRAYRAQQKNHLEIGGAIITDNDRRLELIFIKNEIHEPYKYAISNKLLSPMKEEVQKRGKKMLGMFNSHPLSIAAPGKSDFHGFYKGLFNDL